jgi:ring-1,2-phenylacetyl-CoA epoxidase subunit PaaC
LGTTIVKIFFFSSYQYFLYEKLAGSADPQLSAIAEKSLKEVTYHVRWSSEWVIRLGDGTEESHNRIQNAINNLWSYTDEMFQASGFELLASREGISIDGSFLKDDWNKKVLAVLEEAKLSFQQ